MALRGVQVIEMAGLAPAPFCGMILTDFGAKVIRIDKITGAGVADDPISHGKFSLAVNLKKQEGIDLIKNIVNTSDVFIDPFRAGVMEKMGLGPDDLMKHNNRLIYARLSGYGQSGSMADKAGHDINFLSLSGVLSTLGWSNKAPSPPLNLLADFGGGGLTCALGIVLALYERHISGKGQVVDCSMTRGSSYLASWVLRSKDTSIWCNERGKNILDGGCYFYDTYETKDGKWMAVGALEDKFYNNLLLGLNLSPDELPYMSPFETGRRVLSEKFLEHTQEHWINVFSNIDACVTPVLSIDEAENHDHNKAQHAFPRTVDGCIAPSPEPRLSRTPGKTRLYMNPPSCGEQTFTILKENGYTVDKINSLAQLGIIKIGNKKSKL